MAYLHGQGMALTFGGAGWEGNITSIRHKQTLDHAQVEVMGQDYAETVTGAYHTVYTIGFAVQDGFSANDIVVGGNAALELTYATPDKLALTDAVIVDVEVNADVEGAVVGTFEIAGNSAMAHTVT